MKILIVALLVCAYFAADQIGFVFEVVRHGSRGPMAYMDKEPDKPINRFHLGIDMLTQTGMRERFTLGRSSRHRYMDKFKLLDPMYNPNQIHVESTNFFRTIQSV